MVETDISVFKVEEYNDDYRKKQTNGNTFNEAVNCHRSKLDNQLP
jgi:hypothetical protein